MPSTGFYLFLQQKSGLFDGIPDWLVSMPSTGFYLFLRYHGEPLELDKLAKCVNALNGLLLISST